MGLVASISLSKLLHKWLTSLFCRMYYRNHWHESSCWGLQWCMYKCLRRYFFAAGIRILYIALTTFNIHSTKSYKSPWIIGTPDLSSSPFLIPDIGIALLAERWYYSDCPVLPKARLTVVQKEVLRQDMTKRRCRMRRSRRGCVDSPSSDIAGGVCHAMEAL
jgi:hypothetical protein